MQKPVRTFEDFLLDVHPALQPFVTQTHASLLEAGYRVKIDMAKNGFLVSYQDAKTRRSLLNYVFRKANLVVRIYGERVGQYLPFMETLPPSMAEAIDKAPVCRRLVTPGACNARCPMGYDFTMRGKRHQKCRYTGFMFPLTGESAPYIKAFLAHEAAARGQ